MNQNDIEIKGNILKPGDVVYVPVRENGKTKPGKVRVGEVAVVLTSSGCSVQLRAENGNPLPMDTYPDPWVCQKAIDILEKYKKLAEQELDALRAEKNKESK